MPRKLLRRFLPNPAKLKENRLLGWMGTSLHHPRLWHISREGIARGAAIGLFFGFLVPIGQIPLAAMFAILLHANLPMAALSTLVTNPFTFGPVYYFAYKLGAFLLGTDSGAVDAQTFETNPGAGGGWLDVWLERLVRLGKPLYTGLIVLAFGSATLSYFLISWTWKVLTMREWRQRGLRRRPSKE
jgi:uncharacterized protein (DUF2062 family)